jgi:hypothetical protein
LGYTVGAPAKYKTPQEMEEKIAAYFKTCEPKLMTYEDSDGVTQPIIIKGEPYYKQEPPTKSGLALFLGFESRQSLWDYEQKKAFSYIIKRAKLALSEHHEKGLDKEKCTGHIFWLKCNGAKEPVNEWNDKAEETSQNEDRTLKLVIDWGTDDAKSE